MATLSNGCLANLLFCRSAKFLLKAGLSEERRSIKEWNTEVEEEAGEGSNLEGNNVLDYLNQLNDLGCNGHCEFLQNRGILELSRRFFFSNEMQFIVLLISHITSCGFWS